jgi:hypothetical protein
MTMRTTKFFCRQTLLLALALSIPAGAQTGTIFYPLPARVVGHASLTPTSASPNLVEGRELYSPQGAALDFSTSPPALWPTR